MKALLYLGPNKLTVSEIASPVPDGDEVLLEPLYVGICGTDLLIASGGLDRVQPPVALGHEMVCRIVEGQGFMKGQLVFINPLISCGKCPPCVSEQNHICTSLALYGIDRDGGLAQQMVAKRQNLVLLPSEIDPQLSALIEPLSVAVHMYRRVAELPIDNSFEVLVIGGGPIGVLIAEVARLRGHNKIVIVEPNSKRREMANSLGFESMESIGPESKFRLVFEATGVPKGLELALESVRPRGVILLGGLAHGPLPFQSSIAVMKEVTLIGSRVYEPQDVEEAVQITVENSLNLAPLVTSVVSLDHALSEGFERLRSSRDEMKILIEVGE
tara:strand:+ start:59 stop:1045 length:987 start_codon:yes stop_codon:yes gene_type:complete